MAAVLVAAATAATLTACGADDEPVRLSGTFEQQLPPDQARGTQLATEGMRLLKSARSLRLNAAISKGSATAGTAQRIEVSLRVDRHANCTGTFDGGQGQRGELLVVEGGATHIRFTEASLDGLLAQAEAEDPAAAAAIRQRVALVRGKYLRMPQDNVAFSKGMCDLSRLSQALDGLGDEDFEGTVRAERPTYRHGRHVIPVVDVERGDTNVMYVAAEGEHRITSYEAEEDGERRVLRLSDYNEPFEVRTPSAAEVVDASEFGGPAGADLFEV
ncbi:hypothetical protein [Streptomyces flavofungini]|uniref:hypothetical protein n=1 Tax=Streptomyces flavofungini TaxID=68200 RepID=UPI0025B08974|nr:hypothetical protein [Streptomyces flavofungini]WJV46620.1 hypothetical protein QUY26_14440 [Streptomyces flavofungini]